MKEHYSLLLRNWIFPLTQRVQNRDVMGELVNARRRLSMSTDELKEFQFSKMKLLLDHAYSTVPFYRNSFNNHGLVPDDIQSWTDFSNLPILEKDHIRQNPGQFLSEMPPSPVKEVRTGGSTGEPMIFHMDQRAFAAAHISRIRSLELWGVNLGDREIRFWGHSASFAPGVRGWYQKRLLRPFKDLVMNRRTFSAYDMSPQEMDRYWKVARKYRPKYLFGYASTLYVFASYLKEQGIDGKKLQFKAIVSCAEILFDWQKSVLEEVFGCAVVNEYGASEVGVIGYGCPCGDIHVMEDFIYVEVLQDGSNHELGNVVVTHLDNLGSPLIRYSLEDLAVQAENDDKCTVGVGFSKLKKVIGRQHDLIRLSSGQVIHGEFFTHIFDYVENIEKFQVVQRRFDFFEISVVLKSGSLLEDEEAFVRKKIFENLGSVHVKISQVAFIQTEASAKFRWVKSEIERQSVNTEKN